MANVGFAAATTNEIARVAGVSIGTIYRYYPSKQALFAELIRRRWQAEMASFVVGALGADPPRVIVERAVRAIVIAIAGAFERYGALDEEANQQVHIGHAGVADAIALVAERLDQLGPLVLPKNTQAAAFLLVRSVMFLSRIAQRDCPEQMKSGVMPDEITALVMRYLFG